MGALLPVKGGRIEVKNKFPEGVFNPCLSAGRLISVIMGRFCLNLGESCAITCHRFSHSYYFWLRFNYRQHEANLGYLADSDGRLGIQGEVIYNTGRQLSLDFLSGFLAGGSEALSQAETSTVVGAYGQTSRNVTGNTGRYAMFSGLANSAQGMSSYYQKQLEAMIPAVKIEAGKKVGRFKLLTQHFTEFFMRCIKTKCFPRSIV